MCRGSHRIKVELARHFEFTTNSAPLRGYHGSSPQWRLLVGARVRTLNTLPWTR
jgi:hypothetical protein